MESLFTNGKQIKNRYKSILLFFCLNFFFSVLTVPNRKLLRKSFTRFLLFGISIVQKKTYKINEKIHTKYIVSHHTD